jgi:hypothetical protein
VRLWIVVVGIATALSGCQTASYRGDINSPYYVVPAGARLVLGEELKLGPDQVSVYVQNGQVLRMSQVQVYSPFCKFELNHQSEAPRTVAPDQIDVTRAFQYRHDGGFSANSPPRRQYLAANLQVGQMGGEGGAPLHSYITQMDLRSEKQPEIFRMTCLRWSYPGMPEHISIAEIKKTLNPLFTLRMPGES